MKTKLLSFFYCCLFALIYNNTLAQTQQTASDFSQKALHVKVKYTLSKLTRVTTISDQAFSPIGEVFGQYYKALEDSIKDNTISKSRAIEIFSQLSKKRDADLQKFLSPPQMLLWNNNVWPDIEKLLFEKK